MALAAVKTFVAAEVLTAADLNTLNTNILNNALTLISPLTGNLDAAGFDITALDELAFTDAAANPTAAGRLRRNGAALVWQPIASANISLGGGLDRDTTIADVVNTTVATSVYSFSVPASTLGTSRMLRLSLIGDYLNNSGAGSTLAVNATYGGVTIFTFTTASIASDANRRALMLDVLVATENVATSEAGFGRFVVGGTNTASGTGAAAFATAYGTTTGTAVDSGAAQTLGVTFQHSVANANISARATIVHVEWIV